MGLDVSRQRRRRGLVVGLVGLCALLFSACQPGWTNPLAGTGEAGSTGDGGPAVDATFEKPGSIVFEQSTGAYYVVDNAACVIRKVSPGGTISTIAGNGICGYSGDGGPATQASIDPAPGMGTGGLAQGADGTLYLADSGTSRVRMITVDGTISTLATDTNPPVSLLDVAVSTAGTVYVALGYHGLGKVAPDGTITPVMTDQLISTVVADPDGGIFLVCLDFVGNCAGSSNVQHLEEGSTTPTFVAALPTPDLIFELSIDASGNLYVATSAGDVSEGNVLRIDSDGTVTTIAGNGMADPGTGKQMGYALELPLSPMGIAATKNNGLLVSSGHVVYRIDKPAM